MSTTDKIREIIEAGQTRESPWTTPVQFAREIVGQGLVDAKVSVVEALTRRVINTMRPMRIVVVSDVHIPFENKAAVDNFIAYVGDAQPDVINVNGDLLDCYSISRYPSRPGKPDMQAEFDAGAIFFGRLRDAAPDAQIDYGLGNHEDRLERLLIENKGIFNLRDLCFERQLRLGEFDVECRDYMRAFNYGPLSVVHGKKVSKHAAYSAKRHLVDYGYDNVIIGHTHRMGCYCHTGEKRTSRAYEAGGLFDTEQAEYAKQPLNWQNGFAVADVWHDGHLNVNLIEVAPDGRFVADGRVYA